MTKLSTLFTLACALCAGSFANSASAKHCAEVGALATAAAKIYAARGDGSKTTICHVASSENDCTRTEVLPNALAKRRLAQNPSDFSGPCESTDFVMVAVSGTLEEGFPLRPNLDYKSPTEQVDAVYLGRALIRGVRAHLDMKEPGSREYKAPPELNPVNPALVPTGDELDANISSIYLVDRRQAARALLNEPRYLSMVPDLAKVDIHAEETDPAVRKLLLQAIAETPGMTNTAEVTFLQVISTWHSCHFIESPLLYTKPDGTRVTDFPHSLASFAGTTDETRTVNPSAYNAAVEAAVRAGVALTGECTDPPEPNLAVPATIDYAVDKTTKRMNDAYRPCAFEEFAARAGLRFDIPQCPN